MAKPTDYEIAIACAKDARERGLTALAEVWDITATGLVPPVPYVETDRETMPDGSNPIRLSRAIRVF